MQKNPKSWNDNNNILNSVGKTISKIQYNSLYSSWILFEKKERLEDIEFQRNIQNSCLMLL